MLPQIALASVMIVLTAGIQTVFTVAGVRTLRRLAFKERVRDIWGSTLVVGLFVLWLFLATVLQVGLWALLYLARDALTFTGAGRRLASLLAQPSLTNDRAAPDRRFHAHLTPDSPFHPRPCQ